MHLYNAWLPPPVAEESIKERDSFSRVVSSVKNSYRSDDPDSVYATLKWVSVIDLFIKAKSEVSMEDASGLIEFGLELFHVSENKLYAQVRWGNILVKLLNKYRKKLSVKVKWRPLYDTLIHTHFSRNTGPEGWRLRQRHFEATTSLVRSCRKFFPPGSAVEIWSEFRSLLENPWHNSSFEGSGFVRLFLPTNLDNQEFFTHDWIKELMDLWDSIPNCQFWNSQWTAIIARVVKNYRFIDWESYLPTLFTRFLNMFEVPVANGSGSYPFSVDVPRNTRFLFSNRTVTPAKGIAKSIVYLLKPGSSVLEHFEKLVNLLEQYYHPSNGGRWTYSLERFLLHLVISFQKRLQNEQLKVNKDSQDEQYLGNSERHFFVKVVLKLIERGQYSKNEHLSETVAAATSILSYVEPSLILPFVASRFHMALETMTATHQLQVAVMSVAFVGRSLFLKSLSTSTVKSIDIGSGEAGDEFIELLMVSLSNALLGMDANDPPKTLATMQLIGSIFSNMSSLDDEVPVMPMIRFSEWLDEFFCRLFALLLHLEPSSVTNEGLHSSATSGTFLVEDGPYYYCMLEILFGRLSKPLYNQALKKISKFVKTNILPGAIAEVGLLCCACVYSNPEEAVTQLVEPILLSVISSLEGTPSTGFGGRGICDASVSTKAKPTISPALETAIDYQLKILSVAISYGGPALLRYKDQFKEAVVSAFESPSWKVNGAGDHLLRSLLGSLVLYYPIDQYKCILHHPNATALEEWISSKDYSDDKPLMGPKWHIPSVEEVKFANELLDLHFRSALDDLLRICQTKVHSDPGDEKEHLKVTLLRIDSSLQGVLTCLPDFTPSSRNGTVENPNHGSFLIAGATGATVGNTKLREKAAEIIHAACKYLLENKSDDSILLVLIIRIMDALGNYGSMEYDEWANHRQAWKLESAAIIEPSINFIVSAHSKGKRRPRWALIDKAFMHNTWRSSQSSYHIFRTGNFGPPEHVNLLVDDLLNLSLHSYETVRILAGKYLLKMIKRWPSMISKCVLSHTENLRNPKAPEYAVLGSCAVLATQTVLKHLTMDPKSFSSFILGILSSSHHESLKTQKAINELFVKYNIHFAGVSRSYFNSSDNHVDAPDFADLVSQISSMSFDSMGLHWRYNLMANRVLLLLAMASRNDPSSSSKILSETAGHFLKNLKSQLPQTRILAISALNTLLKESPYKLSDEKQSFSSEKLQGARKSSLEGELTQIFQEDGFFSETLNSLSHVHIISDTESSTRSNHGNSSFQSLADKSITRFYFDFTSSWPRTPTWISLLGSDTFYSNYARIFKRLIQECGMPVVVALKSSLEEFSNAKERSKQCVAAEAFAGMLHSDVNGIKEAWDNWMVVQLQNIILAHSVESIPEWTACIRYAVTGKGKYGTRVPLLRQPVLDCLATPLPGTVTTTVVAKRYAFLSAALVELSPQKMPLAEIQLHYRLLEELLGNMCHSSAQVREAIGVALSVLCSNIRLYESFDHDGSNGSASKGLGNQFDGRSWVLFLKERASEVVINIQNSTHSDSMETPQNITPENGHLNGDSQADVKWMETLFHFIISSLRSARSSYLVDVIVGFLYPVISLQETSSKELSTLAKAAFELLNGAAASPQAEASDGEEPASTVETRQAQAYDNYKKVQDDEAAKKRREEKAAAVRKAREKAQRFALLEGKGLGEEDEGGDMDAKAWLTGQKKRQKKIDKARKLEEELAAAEAAAAAAIQYTSKDLAGIKVAHDSTAFLDGDEQVLTLKDTTIDENEEEGDELENLNIKEQEKLTERLDLKKKLKGYNPNDYDDGEGTILAQYDEEINGKKAKKFTLDDDGAIAELSDILGQPERKGKKIQSISLDDIIDGAAPSSDYLAPSEIKVKKPKKKKGSKGTRQKQHDEDDIFPIETVAADTGAMDVDSKESLTVKKRKATTSDAFADDDDLQASLAIQRKNALKKRKRTRPEDIARQLKEDGEEPEETQSGGLVIGEISEFVAGLSKPDDEDRQSRRQKQATKSPELEEDRHMGDEDEDAEMDDYAAEHQEALLTAQKEEEERIKREQHEEDDDAGIEDEKVVGAGMGAALALLRERGLLESSDRGNYEDFKAREDFLAKKRVLEGELDEQTRQQRERDRMSGRLDRMSVREREEWARQQNTHRDHQQSKRMAELFNAGYKPNVELKYVDDHGRRLDQKEAFKHLSHQFHGKGSGKGKTEKRLKKIDDEKRREAQSMFDASQNAGMNLATAQQLKKRREAGVRLG